jgi:hypothetical protein
MDNTTDLRNLSHDQLADAVMLMYGSNNDAFEKEYKSRCLKDSVPSPFLHAIKAFERVSPENRRPIYKAMKKNWLAESILTEGKKDQAFYGKARSQAAKESIDKEVAKVSSILTIISDIKKAEDINVEFIKTHIDSLKDQKGRYFDELPERTQTGVRKFALAFSRIIGNPLIIDIARSERALKTRAAAHHGSYSLPNPKYNDWLNYYQEYLNESLLKSTRSHYQSFNKFYKYLECQSDSHNPLLFLTKRAPHSFFTFLKGEPETSAKKACIHMYDFTNWIIDNYLLVRDEETGEASAIGVPIFSPSEVKKIKDFSTEKFRPAETVKTAMPTSWLIKCREIITENDFEWPKSRSNDYFWYRNPESGLQESIWAPVNAFIILMMLELPIRKIQVLSLDSGEGDDIYYDIEQRTWRENTSRNAKYWKKIGSSRKDRGVIKKIYTPGEPRVGFYINTNKTQDREHGFSETSGYTLPWNNEYLIRKLSELRAWQEQYNPVDKPTHFKDIPSSIFDYHPTEAALALIPDRFYLFRSPLANKGQSPDCPPSENLIVRFWWDLMDELEKQLKIEGQDVEIIIKRNKLTGQPERSIFTPHSLRVSGLSALFEAGVPIEILSKIVAGHATILMTFYYLKVEPGHITEILNDAKKKIENEQQEDLRLWLANAEHSEAQRYIVRNDDSTLQGMSEGLIPSGLWINNNLGICPYAGQRCHDGGEVLHKSNKYKAALYGPVPGGKQNCVRCRHFVTGTPWLIPLWLHTNKLLLDAQKKSKKLEDLRKNLELSVSQRFRIAKEEGASSIPASLQAEIKGLEHLLEKEINALDTILMNAHATYNLVADVREILFDNSNFKESESNLPKLITSDTPEIGFKEVSEFRALDEIVQAGRLYMHVHDKNFENERNHFIDQVMFSNGATPISLVALSDAEKSAASDAAAKFLLTRLEDYELESLMSCKTTLEELGIKSELIKCLNLERSIAAQKTIFKPDR